MVFTTSHPFPLAVKAAAAVLEVCNALKAATRFPGEPISVFLKLPSPSPCF